MGARSSLSALLATTALGGPARASLSVASAVTQLGGPIRASASYLLSVQSFARGFSMSLVDSSSAIYGASTLEVVPQSLVVPEYNPYKPIVPQVVADKLGPDGYAYIEENQETLREQHNLTQAGDTTFPFQLIITSHQIKHYKLGAVGRFYHEDYGIIHARYVQFDQMLAVATPCCPVGLFRAVDSLDWVVTNDYSKSNPDLVVGIAAPWTLPANKDYGWVIVDGPILQQVTNNSTTFAIGEAFVWDSSGAVSNTAAGKIVGRRVNKTSITRLPAGTMWVRSESYSEAQINAIITAGTKSLLDELTALERTIATLPSAAALKTLTTSVATLKTTLSNEASARIASDLRLNERISNLDFVTVNELNAAVATATTEVAANLANLAATVTYLSDSLNARGAQIDDMLGTEARLQTQLDAILALVMEVKLTPRSKFPVVDGGVPPSLVYIPDGTLVYTEE